MRYVRSVQTKKQGLSFIVCTMLKGTEARLIVNNCIFVQEWILAQSIENTENWVMKHYVPLRFFLHVKLHVLYSLLNIPSSYHVKCLLEIQVIIQSQKDILYMHFNHKKVRLSTFLPALLKSCHEYEYVSTAIFLW